MLGIDVDCEAPPPVELGREVAMERRLDNGEEFELPLPDLMRHGGRLFDAVRTVQEGGGRPARTDTGNSLADPGRRLEFPFNMNRVSAPDASSCGGCHNLPRASGDSVANVFLLGQPHRPCAAAAEFLDEPVRPDLGPRAVVAGTTDGVLEFRGCEFGPRAVGFARPGRSGCG